MHFQHAPDIWQQFPQLVAGAIVAEGIHAQVDITLHLQPWYQRAREKLGQETESALPEVGAWRRAYTQMGLKPTQYRSAAEALLRRFRRGDTIPSLHPLVDLCNAVSLAFALPVAVFDLDHVDSFLEVRHASGTEHYLAFSGEIEHPDDGEVIFADAAQHAHARRWTFRQSKQSTVHDDTRRVLIVSEGLHATAVEDVQRLIGALADQVGTLWSPVSHRVMLSAPSPRLTW